VSYGQIYRIDDEISLLFNLYKVTVPLYVETVNVFGAESHPNWRGC